MSVSNDFYVAKGRSITCRKKTFGEGRRFPAADLALDERSFDSLRRDGVLVTGKERNAFLHPKPAPAPAAKPPAAPPPAPPKDGLEEMKKDDLLDMAGDLGIRVSQRLSKEEIIEAIRKGKGK